MAIQPIKLKKVQIPAFIATLVWFGAWAGYLYFFLGFATNVALIDAAVGVGSIAIACVIISNFIGYFSPEKNRTLTTLVMLSLILGAILYINYYALTFLFSEDVGYTNFVVSSLFIRGVITFITIGWCTLASQLYYQLAEQSELQERLLTTQNLAKEAELNKLRHQLQPHFLFNSLNSVYALTIMNPSEAGVMITKLASFLRGTLKRDDEVWVKVEEEMEYIQLYLDIEKVRFSHRLNISIDIQEEALELQLPGTFLQPIVENAIKFGLYNTSANITISVAVSVENDVLLVRVENPYDAKFRTEKGTRFGLSAIRRRLYLLFGDSNLLSTESVNDSLYITQLKIPQAK